MKVKYKGYKKQMPVLYPIGVQSKSSVKKVLIADPYLELEEKDAHALVALDPHNFEIVEEEKAPKKPAAPEAPEAEVPAPAPEKPKAPKKEKPAPKKRGSKKAD